MTGKNMESVFIKIWCFVSQNPPTHRVGACRPFPVRQIFNCSFLPSFLSSFLLFFLSSEPPTPRGEIYLPPFTPLLATSSLQLFVPGPPRNLFFRCQFSHGLFKQKLTPQSSKSRSQKRASMASKINPNMERKQTWGISGNHEKIIRKRGAETSKTILPCGRRCSFTQIG
jgi:hypothetical protein